MKRVMADRARIPGNVVEEKMTEDTPFKAMLFEIGRGLSSSFDPTQSHTWIKE